MVGKIYDVRFMKKKGKIDRRVTDRVVTFLPIKRDEILNYKMIHVLL